MSAPEVTEVTHPDGSTITCSTDGATTTTTVVHADGTTMTVATTGDPAGGKPRQRMLLPTTVTPSHYDVHLTPDFEKFTFAGVETVSMVVNGPDVYDIVLHVLDITISEAKFVGADGSELCATNISYQTDKRQTATLAFGSALQVGSGRVTLTFAGELNDKMCGFYRSAYTGPDGQTKLMATTQFEATDARRAFPCWDEPALKATFAFTLTVPNHMTAVSNMPIRSSVAGEDGSKTVAFDTTCVMSTYLGAFVIGEMDSIEAVSSDGIPCRVYATAGKESQGAFALDVCTKVLSFFSEYFGIPYPLPKMDMLAIPDFAAGAMENYGCVTYRETAILWDPDKSAVSAKQRVAYVVAHELAHQWFGNLTTMQWWDNLVSKCFL
jgi:aminopeptidase N